MRNSTNIFLVNLSVADLCVLVICTPTVLIEVNSGPQIWPLGKHMCKSESTRKHEALFGVLLFLSFLPSSPPSPPLDAMICCRSVKSKNTGAYVLPQRITHICTRVHICVRSNRHAHTPFHPVNPRDPRFVNEHACFYCATGTRICGIADARRDFHSPPHVYGER